MTSKTDLVADSTAEPPAPGDPARLDRAARHTAGLLLVLFAAVIVVIVFWPGPPDPGGQTALSHYLHRAHTNGLPYWISFDLVQNLANVVMFVPLGLLGSLALRRHNFLVVVAAGAGSVLIELVQLVLLPDRVASLADIASNTIGAFIGFLFSIPALRRRRRRRRRYEQGRRGATDSKRQAARAARS